jgi:predicted secreted protein
MGWFTGIIMFVLVWWTVLFAVLPLGQQPESEADPVSGFRGLPKAPRIGRVMIITTLVSAVVWLGCDLLISSSWLSFRHGVLAFHPD